MARPVPQSVPNAIDRPPPRGWYWNVNHLARAWVPLIGLEGLGLLDYYLARADCRPGTSTCGWAAVTLDELAGVTGWGRARLVRLNRLLAAAGLLTVGYRPVPGRGPAIRRAVYRVERQAPPPTAAALARLAPLAARDPALAARLQRFTPADTPAPDQPAPVPVAPAPTATPEPVPSGNRSVDSTQTCETTTTNVQARVTMTAPVPAAARPGAAGAPASVVPTTTTGAWPPTEPESGSAVSATLDLWRDANGRVASPLERQRLAQLAAQAARAAGGNADAGWRRVGEAIVEAVDAGSTYVAPRRVARILERWLADGPLASGACAVDAPARAVPAEPRQHAAGPEPAAAPAAVSHAEASPASADDRPDPTPWQPPVAIVGLPAAPAAVLRAALAVAGLTSDPYLRGAALAGWVDTAGGRPGLSVATPAPAPPAVVARLQPRLGQGLSAVLGRPVAGRLTSQAALSAVVATAVRD